MAYRTVIPTEKDQAEKVVGQWVQSGLQMQAPYAVKWGIAHWYMRGARNFTNLNYQEGSLRISYLDESGHLTFQYEDILAKFQTQLGRLIGMRLAPVVKQRGISLEGMRKRGIAQAALNVAFPSDKVDALTEALFSPLLTYGMLGLLVWVEDEDSMGIEVAPPWELLPIPSHPATVTDVRGIIRIRPVPKAWIEGLTTTPGSKSQVYNEIEGVSVPVGNVPTKFKDGYAADYAAAGGTAFAVNFSKLSASPHQKQDKTTEEVVKFVEVWTWTPDNYLAEYAAYAGWANFKELHRSNFAGRKVHRPIHTVRDIQISSFYGRSYVDMLIPTNVEMEYSVGKMFELAQTWDTYGFLMEPTTAGINTTMMDGADGVKRVRYEVDYTSPNPLRPEQVKPVTPGPFLVNALTFGKTITDSIANQPSELMSGGAPGRVDSSAGIGTLYELSQIPLSPTAKSVALGVTGCYKAMLGIIGQMWQDDKIINMTMLDDSLAGIVLDTATGKLKLTENALPHPDEVEIVIASEAPVSREQQKMEMREELKQGTLSPIEYRIEVRKRGLDLPVGGEIEWQSYRRAMLENIVLFGDGQKPGEVIWSERDLHVVHLMVLSAFIAKPEFYAASPEVREAFVRHYEAHQAGMGQYPNMEYGEESARQVVEGMQGQMGGGGMEGMPQ